MDKLEIQNKISLINEQILIRETIPTEQRTNKQNIKLDNLLHELKELNELLKK
jgi:hypothetical protein